MFTKETLITLAIGIAAVLIGMFLASMFGVDEMAQKAKAKISGE